jgi:hypothetical protein
VKLETSVSSYFNLPVVVLDLVFISGLTNAHDPSCMEKGNGTLSTFPSFYVEDGEVAKGWMTWAGNSECRWERERGSRGGSRGDSKTQ